MKSEQHAPTSLPGPQITDNRRPYVAPKMTILEFTHTDGKGFVLPNETTQTVALGPS